MTDHPGDSPQTAYSRAVNASIAHEATHSLAWRLPCRTCDELRALEDRALDALVQRREP